VNHKPECNEKWEYDKDHCICNWIDKAERRIIKLLEDDYFHLIGSAGETWNGKLIMEKVHLDGCLGCEQIALIKGESNE